MVGMVILAIILFTAVVMLLWNAVLVPVLGVGIITYWQAMGILILSKVLFGGKGKHGYGKHHHCYGYGHKHGHHHHDYKRRWKEKFENLSDEEKEKMEGFFRKFKNGDERTHDDNAGENPE